MKSLFLLTVAVALLALPAAGASAGGGYDRECGDQEDALGAPWTNLKADDVSCRAARKVADAYTSGDWDGEYRGWTCDGKVIGPEELKVKCKRDKNGGQRARFFWGA